MLDSQNDLQLQRRKNAELEKQLGKARVEQAQSGLTEKEGLNLKINSMHSCMIKSVMILIYFSIQYLF